MVLKSRTPAPPLLSKSEKRGRQAPRETRSLWSVRFREKTVYTSLLVISLRVEAYV